MVDRRAWVLLVMVLLTVVGFGAMVVITGLVACGVSGCGGAGFGPAFAPVQAQVGLLVAGVSLAPLVWYLLRGRGRFLQGVGVVVAIGVGAALAMVVLRLGPNGCPWGQSQATASGDALEPGSLTCSGDRNAVPPN